MSKVIKIKPFVEMPKVLNPQQMAAIAELEGCHLISSGAGTGKSTVLVERMKAIKAKYPEATILMLSFSKDSALELKSRVGTVAGVTISTFHSLAYHVLQSSGWKFKVDCNSENQTAVITNLIGSRSKTTAEEVIKSLHNSERGTVATLRIRKKYLQWLKENHVVSFDTMILFAVEILQKHKGMRSYWQNRYDFIQIDEGQDLCEVQIELARMMTATTNNLCVCGDYRQQIYSFRGATGAMEELSENATIHELTLNYRCNQGILNLANSIMKEYSPLESSSSRSDFLCGKRFSRRSKQNCRQSRRTSQAWRKLQRHSSFVSFKQCRTSNRARVFETQNSIRNKVATSVEIQRKTLQRNHQSVQVHDREFCG